MTTGGDVTGGERTVSGARPATARGAHPGCPHARWPEERPLRVQWENRRCARMAGSEGERAETHWRMAVGDRG